MTFYKVLKCCNTSLSFSQTQQYRPALRWQVFYLIVRPASLPDSLLGALPMDPCWGGGYSTDPVIQVPTPQTKSADLGPPCSCDNVFSLMYHYDRELNDGILFTAEQIFYAFVFLQERFYTIST